LKNNSVNFEFSFYTSVDSGSAPGNYLGIFNIVYLKEQSV